MGVLQYRASATTQGPSEVRTDQPLPVTIISGGGSSSDDGDTFVPGTTGVSPVGYIVDDVATSTVAEDAIGAARMTDDRKQIMAGYDASSNANRGFEVAPIWAQYLGETIVSVTNETDGTNSYYVDMSGYAGLNLQLIISGGSGSMTVTIEATAQDDGTTAASCTYHDVTNDVFGAASYTASTFLFDDQKTLGGAKFVKIKTVSSTGAANDADITVHAKRLY